MSDYSLDLPVLELGDCASPLFVRSDSPDELANAVLLLSVYFRKELGFDRSLFSVDVNLAPQRKDFEHVYVFHEMARDWMEEEQVVPRRVFGACHFVKQGFQDGSDNWCLRWVWFHPFFRRRGHLREVWPSFRSRYGQFEVEHPLSAAMEKFLQVIESKIGFPHSGK